MECPGEASARDTSKAQETASEAGLQAARSNGKRIRVVFLESLVERHHAIGWTEHQQHADLSGDPPRQMFCRPGCGTSCGIGGSIRGPC